MIFANRPLNSAATISSKPIEEMNKMQKTFPSIILDGSDNCKKIEINVLKKNYRYYSCKCITYLGL